MKHTLRTAVVATAVLCAALVATAPAYAGAAPAHAAAPSARPLDAVKPLDAAKLAVTRRIDLRLATLKRLAATLGDAKQVNAAHRGTLNGLVGDQTAGLTALRAKVGAEATTAAVKSDAQDMVDDYRVFILTGPKVRLTAAIDTEEAVLDRLHDRGVDDAKLQAIRAGLAGKVDTLLAIAPGPDGDAIRAQVKTVREAARTARAQLKALA